MVKFQFSAVSRAKFGWVSFAAEKREQTPFDCKNSDNVSLVQRSAPLSWLLPLTLSEFISFHSECHIAKLSHIVRLHLRLTSRRDAYTFFDMKSIKSNEASWNRQQLN
jgi:hypothetical protein